MLTLYDCLFSGNGYKVRLALRELGLPFAYRQLDILRGETREPWFVKKNPIGQIPVLEFDDGTCLAESSAILFHLARGTHLLPSDPLLETRVLQWLCFEQTNVDGVISRARFRRKFPEAVPTRPEELEAWWAEGRRALQVLERHVTGSTYLVENTFSIADIALYAYVHRAEEGGFYMAEYTALNAWLRRVEARPAHIGIDDLPDGSRADSSRPGS